jgi:hypothetical protein
MEQRQGIRQNRQRSCALLSTLGKILEAVVGDRISYAVETFGLLPINHFGARKRRSTEQALLPLQEQIYKAWRNRKVVSLISFDVKGAYCQTARVFGPLVESVYSCCVRVVVQYLPLKDLLFILRSLTHT